MAMQIKNTSRARRTQWLAVIVSILIHLVLAPNVGIGAGRANVMLVLAGYVALGVGGEQGVLAGFLAGLFFDLTTTGPIGLMSFELCVMSLVLGREVRNRLADDAAGSMRAFFLASIAVELFYAVAMLITGSASGVLEVLVARTIPSVVLDCVFFVPYLLVGSRGNRGGSAFSGGAGSSALGGKRLRS